MARIFLRAGKLPWTSTDPFSSFANSTTGTNLGNMLFSQSVFKALSLAENSLTAWGFALPPTQADVINDECDKLVLPLANAFRPEWTSVLDRMTSTIRKLKVPVVVVGVGCQTDLDYNYENLKPMDATVKRFVAAVLDRSATIGVRGACTAEYLGRLGFKSVEIIGCPSMFINGPTLPTPRSIMNFNRGTKLSLNISAPGGQAAFSTGLDRVGKMIEQIYQSYNDIEYIPQESGSLEDLLFGQTQSTKEHKVISESVYRRMHDDGHVITFVDPNPWLAHLGTRDFVCGTRLHGGIAALLGGTAAHLIPHDSRLRELAEYHQIPHTTINAVDSATDPQDLYERSDFSAMVTNHAERFQVFSEFLSCNDLNNVYKDGDCGASFEARMNGADLPQGIRSVMIDDSLRTRLQWMHSYYLEQGRQRSQLKREAKAEAVMGRIGRKIARKVRALRHGVRIDRLATARR